MNQYRSGGRSSPSAKRGRTQMPRRRRRVSNHAVIRWLLCFLPVGLMLMWHPSCRWKKVNKVAISMGSLALVAILALGIAGAVQRSGRTQSGVQLVSANPQVEVYGPAVPASVSYSYVESDTIQQAVVITPEPTEQPETAYYNDGGKYFHTENCSVVTSKTPCYSVTRLLNMGVQPCPKCAASELAAEYTGNQ